MQPDGQELSAFKELQQLLKKRCDHRNSQWNFHTFCRLAYHIESGMRGLLGKSCASSRRCLMVVTLMEFCLPLCGEVSSRFDLFKNMDGPRVVKLLNLKWAFKPRPCSTMLPAPSDPAGGSKKGTRKKKRKSSASDIATPTKDGQASGVGEEERAPVVEDQSAEILSTPQVLSRILDEGLWQLLSKGIEAGSDINIVQKVRNTCTVFWALALSKGSGVTLRAESDEDSVNITNIFGFRDHLHKDLNTFSNGYLLVRGHSLAVAPTVIAQPSPELAPLPSPASSPEFVPLPSPSPCSSVGPDITGDTLELLSVDQAGSLMKWLSANSLSRGHVLHGCFRAVQARVLSHAQEIANSNCDWKQVLKVIVDEVCSEIHPAWVSEVTLMHTKNHNYTMFFKEAEHVGKFMKIRKTYITALLSEFGLGEELGDALRLPSTVFQVLQDPELGEICAAAESLVDSRDDVHRFWCSLCDWLSTGANHPVSAESLLSLVTLMQEQMGLCTLDASGGHKEEQKDDLAPHDSASACHTRGDSQMFESQAQTVDSQAAQDESQTSNPEAKGAQAQDGGDAAEKETQSLPPTMAIQVFQTEWANNFRPHGKQEKVRPLATTAAIMLEIEKALLAFAEKKDDIAGYQFEWRDGHLAVVPAITQRKAGKQSSKNFRMAMRGKLSLTPTPHSYACCSIGPIEVHVDGSHDHNTPYPCPAWFIPHSGDEGDTTMHLREETKEVNFTKGPTKQSFECTFKYVDGVEPNVQLVRPSLFAEMAKAKKNKVETFEDAVSSIFPGLMQAA